MTWKNFMSDGQSFLGEQKVVVNTAQEFLSRRHLNEPSLFPSKFFFSTFDLVEDAAITLH